MRWQGLQQMDVKDVTPELSGLPYTCYLYAARNIATRHKVGLIPPKVDDGGALLALYHATQAFPFPVQYVQTDNGLEFPQRFPAQCEELGLEHCYIRKSSPNDNAVIERSFRTDEEELFFWLEQAPKGSPGAEYLVSGIPGDLRYHPPPHGHQYVES